MCTRFLRGLWESVAVASTYTSIYSGLRPGEHPGLAHVRDDTMQSKSESLSLSSFPPPSNVDSRGSLERRSSVESPVADTGGIADNSIKSVRGSTSSLGVIVYTTDMRLLG